MAEWQLPVARVAVRGGFTAHHRLEHRLPDDDLPNQVCPPGDHWHRLEVWVNVVARVKPVLKGTRTGPSIITARSYGDDPEAVTPFAAADDRYATDVGMAIDERTVYKALAAALGPLDYADLNGLLPLYPTFELLAAHIGHVLTDAGLDVGSVIIKVDDIVEVEVGKNITPAFIG